MGQSSRTKNVVLNREKYFFFLLLFTRGRKYIIKIRLTKSDTTGKDSTTDHLFNYLQ